MNSRWIDEGQGEDGRRTALIGWDKTLWEQGEILETEQNIGDSSELILMSSRNMLT